MLGEKVRINKLQAKNEVKALRDTYDGENRRDRLDIPNLQNRFLLLERMLLSFSELPRLENVCQGVINIATMEYTHKKDGADIRSHVFNLNLGVVAAIADNFIDICVKKLE